MPPIRALSWAESNDPLHQTHNRERLMCQKRKFDELGARLALARCKKSRGGHRMERRYYRCEKCGAFHLTSQPEPAGSGDN
jgi:hypothetical protein